MLDWLRSLFRAPSPAGPPELIKRFTTTDRTIAKAPLRVEGEGWFADLEQGETLRLFEFAPPPLERCMITYRVRMKTEEMESKAYLEMWCRLPGKGEFFSKGVLHAIRGTNDWASYEIPFYLKKGQTPDLLKLNLVVEGSGRLWIKDVELHRTPLD